MEKPTVKTADLAERGFWGTKRTVDFGKFDFNGRGRKINKMDVDVRIYDENGDGRVVLSIMGGIWNGRGTDYTQCGQCLDEMAKFVSTPTFKKIYGWWKKYHNNDMHQGDERQEKYLVERGIDPSDPNPKRALAALREAGMEKDSDGYVFGEQFHFHPIPSDVLDEIKSFIAEDPAY